MNVHPELLDRSWKRTTDRRSITDRVSAWCFLAILSGNVEEGFDFLHVVRYAYYISHIQSSRSNLVKWCIKFLHDRVLCFWFNGRLQGFKNWIVSIFIRRWVIFDRFTVHLFRIFNISYIIYIIYYICLKFQLGTIQVSSAHQ